MSKEQFYPPKHAEGQFHCPHCGVFAKQHWSHLKAPGTIYGNSSIKNCTPIVFNLDADWSLSLCEHCGKHIIWRGYRIIFPSQIQVESPNKDLDKDIQKDYLEAANIFNESPRAAAALLRLALQKLCKQLGEKGKNINEDIGNLVKKGLNPAIQKSLDALRITGNNAVHPGEINLSENPERVIKLFELLNFITEKMISEIIEIDEFYNNLPSKSTEAIKKRDDVKNEV